MNPTSDPAIGGETHRALAEHGFVLIRDVVAPATIRALRTHAAELGAPGAGVRNLLGGDAVLTRFANSKSMLGIARQVLGESARAVRMILFDKTPETNWGVPWHQDLNVAIRGTAKPADYGPWSTKKGVPHVVPPAHVLESMITLRLHLDPCDIEQGPLRVIPGSHLLGKIADADIPQLQSLHEAVDVVVESGALLLMRLLLLHSSLKATAPTSRCIIHVEYAAAELPIGLEWFFA